MILINFKIYSQTFGDQALKLAQIIKEATKSHPEIIIAASALDAYRIQKETGLDVYLQNIDPCLEGRGTGWISPLQAQKMGIKGALLNHSEHRLPKGTILKILKSKPHTFKIICCAHSLGQIEWIKKAKPDFILYEPPELIASLDKSIASEKPDSIKKAVTLANPVPLLVGAGIKSSKDFNISLKMGAKGIGLSSAFVQSSDPKTFLKDLLGVLK